MVQGGSSNYLHTLMQSYSIWDSCIYILGRIDIEVQREQPHILPSACVTNIDRFLHEHQVKMVVILHWAGWWFALALQAHANYNPTKCKINPVFMSCECRNFILTRLILTRLIQSSVCWVQILTILWLILTYYIHYPHWQFWKILFERNIKNFQIH